MNRRLVARARLATAAAACLLAAACSSSSSGAGPTVHQAGIGGNPPPDLSAFLALPVATPTVCPPGQAGSASGRVSPWVGHVDISVFVDPSATTGQFMALGPELRAQPHVLTVYAETPAQAYAEYQRLYTCSSTVTVDQVPGSYRLAVTIGTTEEQRDALVVRILHLLHVQTVSCDPSIPCVAAVQSVQPSGIP